VSELEHSAEVLHPQRRRGVRFRPDSALGALHPGLGLVQPPLPGQHAPERHVGDASERIISPAVPLGQLDRLPAAFRRPRKRPVKLDRRLVRQAGELQVRPPDPARQRDALLQVRLGLDGPGCPAPGDAEADQREAAQLLIQAGLRRLRGPGQGLHPLRLLGHRRQVASLAGQLQPDHPEQHLRPSAPAFRHRLGPALGQPQVSLRCRQRP